MIGGPRFLIALSHIDAVRNAALGGTGVSLHLITLSGELIGIRALRARSDTCFPFTDDLFAERNLRAFQTAFGAGCR